MKQHRMTQESAAEKMGIHRVTIARWVTGSMEPRIEQLIVLADLFNVSTDYLLKGIPQGPNPASPEALTEAEFLWISSHRDLIKALIELPKGKIRLVNDLVEAIKGNKLDQDPE